MRCREARALIHEAEDRRQPVSEELQQHAAACTACRALLEASRQASALVARSGAAVSADELDGLTERVMARLAAPGPRRTATWRRWALAGAAAVALFSAGLASGRELWPRTVVVTRDVPRVRVIDRPVTVIVEKPVVRERVVTRRVPVVVPRIVERPVAVADQPPAQRLPSTSDVLTSIRAVTSCEYLPAAVAERPEAPAEPAERNQRTDAGGPTPVATASLKGVW